MERIHVFRLISSFQGTHTNEGLNIFISSKFVYSHVFFCFVMHGLKSRTMPDETVETYCLVNYRNSIPLGINNVFFLLMLYLLPP